MNGLCDVKRKLINLLQMESDHNDQKWHWPDTLCIIFVLNSWKCRERVVIQLTFNGWNLSDSFDWAGIACLIWLRLWRWFFAANWFFTGHMTKPTVSKHRRKLVGLAGKSWIPPAPLHHVTIIQLCCKGVAPVEAVVQARLKYGVI